MKITHENFNGTIDATEWSIHSVVDHYNGSCSVWVRVNGLVFQCSDGMPYTETWEDADVESFIKEQLEKMKA